jgi:hypothetical protein
MLLLLTLLLLTLQLLTLQLLLLLPLTSFQLMVLARLQVVTLLLRNQQLLLMLPLHCSRPVLLLLPLSSCHGLGGVVYCTIATGMQTYSTS